MHEIFPTWPDTELNLPCRERKDGSNDPPTPHPLPWLGYMVIGCLPQVVSLFHFHPRISGAEVRMASDNMTQANSGMFVIMGPSGLGD